MLARSYKSSGKNWKLYSEQTEITGDNEQEHLHHFRAGGNLDDFTNTPGFAPTRE